MRILLLGILVCLCSCRTAPVPVYTKPQFEPVLNAIAHALDPAFSRFDHRVTLSREVEQQLQAAVFTDPAGFTHPRYFDRIHNVSAHQVERSFVDYSGAVVRKEILTLPEEQFYEPLVLVAAYYEKHGTLPIGTSWSIPILKSLLQADVKRTK